ncbi:Nucleoporin nup84 [Rhizoclosmatium sp. JEL0117]|nr:Nucleoporin nup84 [Rhizoclosmatium sp. JEL0117]
MDEHDTHLIVANGEHYHITQEFDEYARLVSEGGSVLDVADVSESQLYKFGQVSENWATQLEAADQSEAAAVEALRLEARTWDLLFRLLDIRIEAEDDISDAAVPSVYSSDQAIVLAAIKKDKNLAELMAVKEWLEVFAPDPAPVENRKGYRIFTQKSLRSKPAGSVAMDPDAPIRTKIQLHQDDANYEHALHRALFSYLRRGDLQSMAQFCRDVDEPWKAASLQGAAYFRDSLVDGEKYDDEGTSGNINRDLWKLTCLEIAKEPSFDAYERAIYGVLGGNVSTVTPVCQTWEDLVWNHYSYYVETVLDQHLSTVPHLTKANNEYSKEDVPESVPLPNELFDRLNNHESNEIRAAAQNPFRIIQAMLILNLVDPLLMSVHTQLAQQSHGNIPQLPTFLRFMVHLILTLRSVSYPIQAKDSADFIIKTYIDLLIAARKFSIVAIYVGQLPSTLQIECYAQFLEGLAVDKETRYEYILQGKECGIDMQTTCRRAVELTFETGIFQHPVPRKAADVFVSNMDDEVSDAVYKQVRALEWVLFDPLQKGEALGQCNRLVRRFLVHGQVHIVREILSTLPEGFIEKKWLKSAMKEATLAEARDIAGLEGLTPMTRRLAAGAVEFLCYTSLVKSFEGLVKWNEFLGMKPLRGVNEGDALDSFQYRDWLKVMQEGTKSTVEQLRGCLSDIHQISLGQGGFLGVEGKERAAEISLIREIYATEIVLRLQHVLFETREYVDGNLKDCIKLFAEFVDDQKDSFHREFVQSGKIVFFMQKHNQAVALEA